MSNPRSSFILVTMMFWLSQDVAFGQWSDPTTLKGIEANYRQLRRINQKMVKGRIKIDEVSERTYREEMPFVKERIAACRAVGNGIEAMMWELCETRLERNHAAVLERQRDGYEVREPFDGTIRKYQRKLLEDIAMGRSAEDSI